MDISCKFKFCIIEIAVLIDQLDNFEIRVKNHPDENTASLCGSRTNNPITTPYECFYCSTGVTGSFIEVKSLTNGNKIIICDIRAYGNYSGDRGKSYIFDFKEKLTVFSIFEKKRISGNRSFKLSIFS